MAKRGRKPSKGLGDVTKEVINLAPDVVVEAAKKVKMFIKGSEDCGCDEDQEALNKFGSELLSKVLGRKTNVLSEKDYNYLKINLDYNKETGVLKKNLSPPKIKFEVEAIYNRAFNTRNFKFGSCPSCASRNKEALGLLVDLMSQYN